MIAAINVANHVARCTRSFVASGSKIIVSNQTKHCTIDTTGELLKFLWRFCALLQRGQYPITLQQQHSTGHTYAQCKKGTVSELRAARVKAAEGS